MLTEAELIHLAWEQVGEEDEEWIQELEYLLRELFRNRSIYGDISSGEGWGVG